MKRRRLLLAGVAGSATLAAPVVNAQARQTLTLGSVWADAAAGDGYLARLSARTASLTSGRLILEVVPQEGTALSLYRAVAGGEISGCFGAEELWAALNPVYSLFTSVPGGMTGDEFEAWIHWGEGRALWQELAAGAGIQPFLAGDEGAACLWADSLPSDPSGFTIATSGLAAATWTALGARVVDPDGSDPAQVLELSAAHPRCGQAVAAGARPTPSFTRPMGARSLSFGIPALERLDTANRIALETAIDAEYTADRTHKVMAGLAFAGTPGLAPAPALTDALAGAARTVLADLAGGSEFADRALQAYAGQIGAVTRWSEMSEAAYTAARKEALS